MAAKPDRASAFCQAFFLSQTKLRKIDHQHLNVPILKLIEPIGRTGFTYQASIVDLVNLSKLSIVLLFCSILLCASATLAGKRNLEQASGQQMHPMT